MTEKVCKRCGMPGGGCWIYDGWEDEAPCPTCNPVVREFYNNHTLEQTYKFERELMEAK